jgi:hypothetical protein
LLASSPSRLKATGGNSAAVTISPRFFTPPSHPPG